MNQPSFTQWLQNETTSAKCVLLTLYEQRDQLKFIEGPRLEKEYMEKVGSFEQTVIQEEMECELLRKKQQMIQIAMNRREPINEAEIDAIIDSERQQMMKDAIGSDVPSEYANLPADQADKLQELYREIVREFHPQTHPELTEAHRQLFEKAQVAYRNRDLEAMQLIYDLLMNAQESEIAPEQLLNLLLEAAKNSTDSPSEESEDKEPTADYGLVAQVYSCFVHTIDEAVIEEECHRYQLLGNEITAEMDEMKKDFPYITADLLADQGKVNEYISELQHRLHTAKDERSRREQEIRNMMKRVTDHE